MVRGPNGRRRRYVPQYNARNVDCNVKACSPCWRWLFRLGRSRNANGGLANVNVTRKKEKPSPLLWTGMKSMKRSRVNGVEITCKSNMMANCVAGVGRFLP